ncbi:MAG: hypothetical protein IT381_04865 [Deltaproteobacteria bacterium]|nr:hypothetical protein [Deltaproteobacteria bacterium]
MGDDKKPSLFDQIKKNAAAAGLDKKTATSPTERMDNERRKQMLDVASEEVRLRPESPTMNRGLLTAMALDEALKIYREAIALLRAAFDLKPGAKGHIKDAKERYEQLRLLKSLAEEDVVAEPNKLHPSIAKLSATAEAIVAEAKKKR